MEEVVKIIFYIVIALVYFFINSRKKNQNRPTPARPAQKPNDDALKKLMEEMKRKQLAAENAQKRQTSNPSTLSKATLQKTSAQAQLGMEENQRRLREIESRIRDAEERNRIDYETDGVFIANQEKDSKFLVKQKTSYYAQLLKNPENLKNAIIINEILQKREY